MISAENSKKIKMIKYTGTIESYNQLVDHLWDGDSIHVWFLDESGSMTPKFTGIVACAKTGIRYRPGDSYAVDIED